MLSQPMADSVQSGQMLGFLVPDQFFPMGNNWVLGSNDPRKKLVGRHYLVSLPYMRLHTEAIYRQLKSKAPWLLCTINAKNEKHPSLKPTHFGAESL